MIHLIRRILVARTAMQGSTIRLLRGINVVVVGGYYQDLSGVGNPPPDISLPDVSASEVRGSANAETVCLWCGGLVSDTR